MVQKGENMIFTRKPTTAGTKIKMEFPVEGTRFLVKNLTEGDIYAAMKDTEDKDLCVLIPGNTAQVIESKLEPSKVITIIPDETSEKGVEAQCLRW
jgi:hypothetical protein